MSEQTSDLRGFAQWEPEAGNNGKIVGAVAVIALIGAVGAAAYYYETRTPDMLPKQVVATTTLPSPTPVPRLAPPTVIAPTAPAQAIVAPAPQLVAPAPAAAPPLRIARKHVASRPSAPSPIAQPAEAVPQTPPDQIVPTDIAPPAPAIDAPTQTAPEPSPQTAPAPAPQP